MTRAMAPGCAMTAAAADLATRARQLAAAAELGSMERRAYGCAAMAIATTRSIPAARRALADWNGPGEVKAAALAALEKLTQEAA